MNMLKSALGGMTPEQKSLHKFVILNGETEGAKQQQLMANITKRIRICSTVFLTSKRIQSGDGFRANNCDSPT